MHNSGGRVERQPVLVAVHAYARCIIAPPFIVIAEITSLSLRLDEFWTADETMPLSTDPLTGVLNLEQVSLLC